MKVQLDVYCNGADTKALCANFKRKPKTFTRQSLPVNRNGAVRTGKYGSLCLVVLDLDTFRRKLPADGLPKTFTVQTGSGGLHLYFWITDAILPNSANPIFNLTPKALKMGLKGVDIRGEGGIVFAPGSKFKEHKDSYHIIRDLEIKKITSAEFREILSEFVLPSPPSVLKKMRRGFLDILNGHFQIMHEFQPETGLPEFLYWAAFWREFLNCGGEKEYAYRILDVTQPEFEEEITEQQLRYLGEADKRPSRSFYLRLFPNAKDARKYDWKDSKREGKQTTSQVDQERIKQIEREIKVLQETVKTLLNAVKSLKNAYRYWGGQHGRIRQW